MLAFSPVSKESRGRSLGLSVYPVPGMGLPCGHVLGVPSSLAMGRSITGGLPRSQWWGRAPPEGEPGGDDRLAFGLQAVDALEVVFDWVRGLGRRRSSHV